MKEFICNLAKKAGALAMEYFNGIRPNEVFSKSAASDLVSTADRAVEKQSGKNFRIMAFLVKKPEHQILKPNTDGL